MTPRFHPLLRLGALGIAAAAAILPHPFLAAPASSQYASIGADVVSRYVWRGIDFGESMSVQPALAVGFGPLEVGAWGSYSVASSGASANEADLYAALTLETSSGAAVSLIATDYYFPGPGATGFTYKEAHSLELGLGLTGPEAFPLELFGGVVVTNDPDNSIYVEASLPITALPEVDLGLVAGVVVGASDFYSTEGTAVTNVGISASKDLEITDYFAVPLSVSYIVSPDKDRAYLVFGFGLWP